MSTGGAGLLLWLCGSVVGGGLGAGGAGEQGGTTNLLGLDYLATLQLWDSDALAPVAFAMKNKSDSLEFSFHKVAIN